MNEQTMPLPGPYARSRVTTQVMMLAVALALMPAFGYGLYRHGLQAAVITGIAVGSSMVFDVLTDLALRKRISVLDFSSLVTGLLLGLSLPVTVPLWMPAAAAFLAIVLLKGLLGTFTNIRLNPVAVIRLILWLGFPLFLYAPEDPSALPPLSVLKTAWAETGDLTQALAELDIPQMIFGSVPGAIGTTSMIAIVIGAAFLLLTGVIDLRIPATMLCTFVFVLLLFAPDRAPTYLTVQLAGGILMFAAFFLATDPWTAPLTSGGKYLYGLLIGLVCAVLRIFQIEESEAIALLCANLLSPLIERVTMPRPFGIRSEVLRHRKAKKEDAPEEEEEDEEDEDEDEEVVVEIEETTEKTEAPVAPETPAESTATATVTGTLPAESTAAATVTGTPPPQ